MQHQDHPDITQFETPLETAAKSIAMAAYMMEQAKAKGKETEVKRLMAQIDRLELAVAKLTEIITEHADAKVRAYQVLCAGAQAELATR